ncbi:nuclear transport factor 2 family protein [Alkalimonas collagenimarina]|uniref:Nuclear transport factor 2 family protein n=1 Tax=Alkalimonas collagenimarina TaxID=400390 RepID=A0ABT9H0J4_9GAMM|nr:nuclear transport factor 2 family protein [Alkalimonas collagenimarina]MDP4536723.1 nuclear transport factor 2 family protein [Alkalimonas collagenimarina]
MQNHKMDQSMPPLLQFLQFYNGLSNNNLSVIHELYHPDVVFVDPVHKIEGSAALEQYLSHAYARLSHCHFTAKTHCQQGDCGFISWQMEFSHQAIGKGKHIKIDGCTELAWHADGRIVFHRDYYDLTDLVYQHLPVLGWATAQVKRRMANA